MCEVISMKLQSCLKEIFDRIENLLQAQGFQVLVDIILSDLAQM